MKKILFFLIAVSLCVSCSNNDGEDSQESGKSYKVKFEVSGFSSNKENLIKSDFELPENGGYFQYVVYNCTDNSVVKNKIIASDKPAAKFDIEDELKEGDYYISIMYAGAHTSNRTPIYIPKKYDEDICSGNITILRGYTNENIYHNTFKISVRQNLDVSEQVELLPMWSEIDIQITDAETFTVPEKVTYISCHITPNYAGFEIATQKANFRKDTDGIIPFYPHVGDNIEAVREKKGSFGNLATEGEDVTIKLLFIEHSEKINAYVWGERTIYQGPIEKGYRYTFSGALGNNVADDEGKAGFDVTLKELAEKDVIPY